VRHCSRAGAQNLPRPIPQRQRQSQVPINFLLGCSDDALATYELARLDDVANDRKNIIALIAPESRRANHAASHARVCSVCPEPLDRNSLKGLLAAGQIERSGKGGTRDQYRYWRKTVT